MWWYDVGHDGYGDDEPIARVGLAVVLGVGVEADLFAAGLSMAPHAGLG